MQQLNLPPVSLTISSTKCLNKYAGELAAIDAGISQLIQLKKLHALPPVTIIFSDSLSALQALQTPAHQSSQILLRNITYNTHRIETMPSKEYKIKFQWWPGHSKVMGNKMAHHWLPRARKWEELFK